MRRSGNRGAFLGMDGSKPTIWQATVDSAWMLAYFNDRDELELVLPHGVARNVRRVPV